MVNDRLSELFDSKKEKIENIERVRPNPLPRFRTTGNHKTPDLPFYTPKDPKTPDKERERESASEKAGTANSRKTKQDRDPSISFPLLTP
jgi:hypothetical protein